MAKQVLIVATSHALLGDTGSPTGCWVEEISSPYYAFKAAGFQVTISSILGGAIPFDPASKSGDFLTASAAQFLADDEAQKLVNNTKSLQAILDDGLDKYDAVFLPGGHGICYETDSPALKHTLDQAWAAGKVVAAVCHGPAGLVTATNPAGEPIVKGRKVTGFTDSEEEAVGKTAVVPFLLEQRLKELGGIFERVDDWHPHAVRDGQLVTGQNPQSSEKVAELIIEALKA